MIADALLANGKKNASDIRNEWNGRGDIEGNAELTVAITKNTPDEVVMTYAASGQKAWINEYGSGSKMDTSNPFLAEYKASSRWNPERKGNEIRTRHGVYYDLDGNPHVGSDLGGESGLNAEWLNKPVKAHEPKHTMKEVITGNTAYNEQLKEDLLNNFGATIKETISKVVRP